MKITQFHPAEGYILFMRRRAGEEVERQRGKKSTIALKRGSSLSKLNC